MTTAPSTRSSKRRPPSWTSLSRPQLSLSSADHLDLRLVQSIAASVEKEAYVGHNEPPPDLERLRDLLADAASLVRRIRRRHDKRTEARRRRGSPLEG